jgi:DNA-binding NtrC family response regulator
MDALLRHDWPGNVRALRHACERAVILGRVRNTRSMISASRRRASPQPPPSRRQHDWSRRRQARRRAVRAEMTLDAIERAAIAATLAQFNGNISHAAKTLGISRAALYRKLGKHGI